MKAFQLWTDYFNAPSAEGKVCINIELSKVFANAAVKEDAT
ncbi:hypothetical protein ABEW60_17090 [Paenibacillus jamilae]|nr:hypothetical protein [Paenibacillus polymyxa]